MLICGDVPRQFRIGCLREKSIKLLLDALACHNIVIQLTPKSSFFDDRGQPMADFGIRLGHIDSFAQLPSQTKVWNIVTEYAKTSYVENIRETLHRLLKCDNENANLPCKPSPRKTGQKLVSLDHNRRNMTCSEIDPEILESYTQDHNASPSADLTKLVKQHCFLTPFLSDEFFITYRVDPSNYNKKKAVLALPSDFPISCTFESDFVSTESEAKYRVSLMVLSELKKLRPEIYDSIENEPKTKQKTPWHKKEDKLEHQKVYQRYFAKQISMVESISLPEFRQGLLEKYEIDEQELGREEANAKLEKILKKLDAREENRAMKQVVILFC